MSNVRILKVLTASGSFIQKGYIRPDEAWVVPDALKLVIPYVNVSSTEPALTYDIPLTAAHLTTISSKGTIVVEWEGAGTDALPKNGNDDSILVRYPNESMPNEPVNMVLLGGNYFDDPVAVTVGNVGTFPTMYADTNIDDIIVSKVDGNLEETRPSHINLALDGDTVSIQGTSADGSTTAKSISKTVLDQRLFGTRQADFMVKSTYEDMVALSPELVKATVVMVIDASSDPEIGGGKAAYFWNVSTSMWDNVFKEENIDITPMWDDIADTPTSTVTDINDMVPQGHGHSNDLVLDTVAVSGDDKLMYNGKTLGRIALVDDQW